MVPKMMFPKPKVARDPKYRRFIRDLPCCICYKNFHKDPLNLARAILFFRNKLSKCCHTGTTGKGTSQKCSDYETVPMCDKHHQEQHGFNMGIKTIQAKYHISFQEVWQSYRLYYINYYGNNESVHA